MIAWVRFPVDPLDLGESGMVEHPEYVAGYIASEQAYPRDFNPHPEFSWLYQLWDGGWCQALDDLCGA